MDGEPRQRQAAHPLEAIRSVFYALDYDGKTRGALVATSPTHRLLVRVPIISAARARPDGHLAAKASRTKGMAPSSS